MQLNDSRASCHSGLSRIFLVFSPHHFVLKKDSRQAGMTDYEEKHEGVLLKQRFTFKF
jgi:hypothetical protein